MEKLFDIFVFFYFNKMYAFLAYLINAKSVLVKEQKGY